MISVVVDLAYRVSAAGPVFRMLLMAAAWLWTAERPTSVWKTLKALDRHFRAPEAAG